MELKKGFSVTALIGMVIIVGLMCSLTTPTLGRQTQPERPLQVEAIYANEHWMPSFVLNGIGDPFGSPFVIATDGTNIYAGGSFNIAGGVVANNIAMWNA